METPRQRLRRVWTATMVQLFRELDLPLPQGTTSAETCVDEGMAHMTDAERQLLLADLSDVDLVKHLRTAMLQAAPASVKRRFTS